MALTTNPAPSTAPRTESSSAETEPLPVSTADVLAGLRSEQVMNLERTHGNGDLIKVLEVLGIGGPFKVISPWELEDETGRHLISAGGYAALPFGEMHPDLVRFVQTYLADNKTMSLPQQATSDWRAALETNLVSLLSRQAPSHADSQVFFSNSGAEAVEAALKFAKAARPNAPIIINFTKGYHGKTFGALSLTPNDEYQAPFRPLMAGVTTLPYGDANAFEAALKRLGAKNIGAVVLEPIQGEGGVIIPPADFLPTVNKVCQQHGILMVADEIQSGLGRTGHWFASLALGLEPDIITLAKPLGGGLVATGATICRRWIMQKMLGGLESKRHSNTFGGNSLAMAVGLKSLELIVEQNLIEKAKRDGERGLARLRDIQAAYPGYIRDVRGAGMLFALQLRHVIKPALVGGNKDLAAQFGAGLAIRTMHQHGVNVCFTLNAAQTIRLTPALNMPDDIFEELFKRVESAAKDNKQAWQMLPKTPPKVILELAKMAL